MTCVKICSGVATAGQAAAAPRAALQRAQLDARAPAVDRQSRVDPTRGARGRRGLSPGPQSSRSAPRRTRWRLAAIAETAPYREPVGWLRCFRGIDTLTVILILTELHDFRRFQSPRALMAYVGLGTRRRLQRRQTSARPHYAHRERPGPPAAGRNGMALSTPAGCRGTLTRRRNGQPGRVIAIADKAQLRLCRRFRRLAEQHKPAPKIAVAIARELAGFVWAALQPAPVSAN